MAKWPYNTIAWQRLRAAKLATDPLCQYCPQGTVTPATQVDHRKAIKDSGAPFAWDRCSRHRGALGSSRWVGPIREVYRITLSNNGMKGTGGSNPHEPLTTGPVPPSRRDFLTMTHEILVSRQ